MVCRTGESWHKEGRQVKPGEHPMKMVPVRAVTLLRKREVEEAERDTGEKLKQGLYARDQTDWIIPPPIENGLIPKNAFGNIDCYVPTMVPEGAVHIRYKGTVKVCKKLEIDYAEAVTGFEFGKQRAVPVITGVVVAKQYEKMVIDAWKIDEEERRKKEDGKREKVALAMWRKFLMGLRIVERVREEYGGDAAAHVKEDINPFTNRNKRKQQALKTSSEPHLADHKHILNDEDLDMAGGFIPGDHGDAVEGGGFISDSAEIREIDVGLNATSEGFSSCANSLKDEAAQKTPRSLQSALREVHQASARSDTDEEGRTEKIQSLAEKQVRAESPRARGQTSRQQQEADMNMAVVGVRAKKVTQRRNEEFRPTTPDTDVSSDLSSPELTSDSEPVQETTGRNRPVRSSRTVADKTGLLPGVAQETSRDPTNRRSNRAVPRRKAAKKSDLAVRSHYFEHIGTEDEDDLDNETSDQSPINASKKDKTMSTSRIRKTKSRMSRGKS